MVHTLENSWKIEFNRIHPLIFFQIYSDRDIFRWSIWTDRFHKTFISKKNRNKTKFMTSNSNQNLYKPFEKNNHWATNRETANVQKRSHSTRAKVKSVANFYHSLIKRQKQKDSAEPIRHITVNREITTTLNTCNERESESCEINDLETSCPHTDLTPLHRHEF